jgi:hypothetical protein
MKEPDKQKRSEITAYHEAGHAVAFYLLHKRFKHVTIKPEGEKWGEIIYRKKILKQRTIPSERELKVIKREWMASLAGPIAEGILFGKCEFKDILPLQGLPSKRTEHERKIDEFFWKQLFVETKLLIYTPWNWHAVGALADELEKQKTIRYKEARKIIRYAIEDYQEGVRSGVHAVDSDYSDFANQVADEKAKRRQGLRAITSKERE